MMVLELLHFKYCCYVSAFPLYIFIPLPPIPFSFLFFSSVARKNEIHTLCYPFFIFSAISLQPKRSHFFANEITFLAFAVFVGVRSLRSAMARYAHLWFFFSSRFCIRKHEGKYHLPHSFFSILVFFLLLFFGFFALMYFFNVIFFQFLPFSIFA